MAKGKAKNSTDIASAAKIAPEHRPQAGSGRPRGLSQARYQELRRLIKASHNKLTWAILEKKGLAFPVQFKPYAERVSAIMDH
jgi:hypothetical protein